MIDLQNSSVLITGGTGSFGKKFCEVALRELRPKKIIIFSRDELKQHDMRNDGFDDPCMRYFIGDVRDRDRLMRAMNGVDVVIHAAALKHVPACEYNPFEAVKTNIIGAQNIVNAALDAGVKNVLALSTDKAVNPVNLYGATKLVAEKIFTQGNSYVGFGNTHFACVRYGNVVGSRGSVVPLFMKQRDTGTVTVTDARMTRFWITLDQGVRFVIDCLQKMHGGEVFVPKIPSMKITDLAKVVAPDCMMKTVGIRPGEKLHEVLLSTDEARHTVEYDDSFVIQPETPSWGEGSLPESNVPEGFQYASDANKEWLTVEKLREMIAAE
ncbi:UDP-N-acetylglucosamine 4,6-dehydratase (inverting) [Candidatus Peribacteria bacterium RIFCSPHIGHO2_01_FULL_54_22]|nr:MAG: UDP-N-acetylglucosamine 4,6-dehydratase (inverting) [Candidatus Peribacteria bacterium RIFCSPHIGHO2_01_FULL_54_22]OGJ63295.1 MAG: UDP-N-acetylglucosamine 4,6-dehydratase (inverting) [Candidatus Peribacteria bacterium RIFCSPHIGHO2_02_FULL_55_24]